MTGKQVCGSGKDLYHVVSNQRNKTRGCNRPIAVSCSPVWDPWCIWDGHWWPIPVAPWWVGLIERGNDAGPRTGRFGNPLLVSDICREAVPVTSVAGMVGVDDGVGLGVIVWYVWPSCLQPTGLAALSRSDPRGRPWEILNDEFDPVWDWETDSILSSRGEPPGECSGSTFDLLDDRLVAKAAAVAAAASLIVPVWWFWWRVRVVRL